MKKNRIGIILLILTFSFTPLLIRDVGGNPSKTTNEEKRLLRIREKIVDERKDLKKAERQEKNLLKKLNSLNKQLDRTENKIVRLKRRSIGLKKEIETLESELTGLNQYLAGYQERLSDRLRVMYRTRHLGYLETILTSSDFASFIRRVHFMKLIATQDARLIQEVREGIKAITQRKDELHGKQEELKRIKRTEEVAKKLRESQRKDRRVLLARVRKQKSIYISRIKELEQASRKIKQMITRREKKKGVSGSLSPKLLRLKRYLAWPLEGGKILRRFGPYRHPKFGTQANSKGIGIEAPYGQVVRSVLGGKVVFADYFKGYGRLAMVDHGDGLHSLYAYLAQISVKIGQAISQGTPIGKVGDSGSIGEAGLHFELRVNGEPVNPLEWLRK